MKHTRLAVVLSLFLLGLAGSSSAQDQSLPYYNAGNTYYSQRNYDQAIRYYQYAGQLNPQLWQAFQGLGNCYYAKGDKAGALANYQKALAINPNNPSLSSFTQSLQAEVGSAPALPGANDSASAGANTPGSPSPANGAVDPNLPKQGKVVIEIEESDWVGSWDDLNKIYGTTITSSATPVGFKFGGGAAYALSPNFLLGAKLQYMKKTEEGISNLTTETDVWDEGAFGGAIEGEGVFSLGGGVNFLGTCQLGFYTLVGSTVTITNPFLSPAPITANLAGSGPGGMLSAGVEFLMDSNKTWAIDLGLAYQFISFSPVTGTSTAGGQPVTFKNATDGSNASLDFSGIGLSLGVRFL